MAVFTMLLRIISYEAVSWSLRSIIQGPFLIGGQLKRQWNTHTLAQSIEIRLWRVH